MSVDCPSCERSFETEHGMLVHHTQSHGRSLAKQGCTCENCDEVFEEFQSRIARGKGRFCSKDCKYDSGQTEATCYHCGETFQRAKHRTGRYEHDYCSIECHRDYRRTGGEAAPGWKGGKKVTKPCEVCGEPVTRNQSQFLDRAFCSTDCFGKGISEDNHPFWSGGAVSWYGTNWREQRRKALERDGYECQSCGLDAESHEEVYGRGLDVHHIVPIAKFEVGDGFDYEAANDLSNLVTLCLECHRTWEGLPVSPEVMA